MAEPVAIQGVASADAVEAQAPKADCWKNAYAAIICARVSHLACLSLKPPGCPERGRRLRLRVLRFARRSAAQVRSLRPRASSTATTTGW